MTAAQHATGLVPPRELIQGDAVGIVSRNGQFYAPARFHRIRPDGYYEFKSLGERPTMWCFESSYGDGPNQWRFFDEPGVTFTQACPCRDKRDPTDVYENPKKQWDCEQCHGRFYLPFEPFANEPRI